MIYAPIIDSRTHIVSAADNTLEVRYRDNPAVSGIENFVLQIFDSNGINQIGDDIKGKSTGENEQGYSIANFSVSGNIDDDDIGSFYRFRIGYDDVSITYSSFSTFKYTGSATLTPKFANNKSAISLGYDNKDVTEPLIYYTIIDPDYPDEIIEGICDKDSLISLNHYPFEGTYNTIQITGKTLNGLSLKNTLMKESKPTSTTRLALKENNNTFKNPNPEIGNIIFETTGLLLRDDNIIGNSINNDSTFNSGEPVVYLLKDGETWYRQDFPDPAITEDVLEENPKLKVLKNLLLTLENIVLSDSEHILPIKFNPKISSYKTVIQEQKLETLGSRFPYFFRGQVNYKEIPISGLLSYLEDEAESFVTWKKDGITTNLIPENVAKEKEFKNKVMNWLNNGQPKLLRTPTEGSFIVRLMNVSLSPNDTLGRMLHTFSATAYEIADCTPANINKYRLNWKEPVE